MSETRAIFDFHLHTCWSYDATCAVEWYFAEAAKLGNIQAQYNLGIMYRDGEGVAKNLNAAAKLFSEACTAGYQDACRELGEGRPE